MIFYSNHFFVKHQRRSSIRSRRGEGALAPTVRFAINGFWDESLITKTNVDLFVMKGGA
jgi:hypothetical protein